MQGAAIHLGIFYPGAWDVRCAQSSQAIRKRRVLRLEPPSLYPRLEPEQNHKANSHPEGFSNAARELFLMPSDVFSRQLDHYTNR